MAERGKTASKGREGGEHLLIDLLVPPPLGKKEKKKKVASTLLMGRP